MADTTLAGSLATKAELEHATVPVLYTGAIQGGARYDVMQRNMLERIREQNVLLRKPPRAKAEIPDTPNFLEGGTRPMEI